MIIGGRKSTEVEITNTSANPVPTTTDFINMTQLNVQAGLIPNARVEIQPGFNNIIDNNEYIISPNAPVNGLDITFPASTVTFSIASTSANDTAAGTGAQQIFIIGLSADFTAQTESLELNGLTPVSSVLTYFRINDILVNRVGSTGSNEGNIYTTDTADTFTAGEPDTRLYEAMLIGDNLSKTMVFTVPKGDKWLFSLFRFQTDATSTKVLEIRLFRKIFGNTVFTPSQLFYVAQGGASIDMSGLGIMFPGEDIKITTKRFSGNGTITLHCSLEGIITNEQFNT